MKGFAPGESAKVTRMFEAIVQKFKPNLGGEMDRRTGVFTIRFERQ
jgi:hypothetical protein